MHRLISAAAALLALTTVPLHASDLERERRIADQIVDAIMDGDPVHLKTHGHEFLAIATPPDSDEPKGAVLILHGRGLHPDWETVVKPLRTGLAEAGWYTLSIQLPVLEKDAKYYDYVPVFPDAEPRIQAALDFLRSQGFERPALIAHSCGAHMAMHWLSEGSRSDRISAYVGIGMGATDFGQPMKQPFALERLRVPVLDVYGSDDYPAVKGMAPERWAAIKRAGHAHSRQLELEGADHYVVHKGPALVAAIEEWLANLGE